MRLIIEERRQGHPAHEEALMAEHAATLNIPVVPMTWKPFVRHRFIPEPEDIISGSVGFVRAALQALGKELPVQEPYPIALVPWLYRRVWRVSKLSEVLNGGSTVFVRPAKRWKLFTGFVVDQPSPAELHGVSRSEPVWCSEVVTWLSEWRVYVVGGVFRHLSHCAHGGDRSKHPDIGSVLEALEAFRPHAPAGYAIDFGVLSTGETALIEANDGFSVGAYDQVSARDYFEMTASRWRELASGSA